MLKPRLDFGKRVGGLKASLPDEFVTKSQLVDSMGNEFPVSDNGDIQVTTNSENLSRLALHHIWNLQGQMPTQSDLIYWIGATQTSITFDWTQGDITKPQILICIKSASTIPKEIYLSDPIVYGLDYAQYEGLLLTGTDSYSVDFQICPMINNNSAYRILGVAHSSTINNIQVYNLTKATRYCFAVWQGNWMDNNVMAYPDDIPQFIFFNVSTASVLNPRSRFTQS